MPIILQKGTGKQKYPRYTKEFNVMAVKLYPLVGDGVQPNLNDVTQNKYRGIRFEIDQSITVTDRESGQPKEIPDGLSVIYYESSITWDKIPPRVRELYKLCEDGKPQKCEIKYYVSVKADPEDPEKPAIKRKRISTNELKDLKVLGDAQTTISQKQEGDQEKPKVEIEESTVDA